MRGRGGLELQLRVVGSEYWVPGLAFALPEVGAVEGGQSRQTLTPFSRDVIPSEGRKSKDLRLKASSAVIRQVSPAATAASGARSATRSAVSTAVSGQQRKKRVRHRRCLTLCV